jgi:hypothetical protein
MGGIQPPLAYELHKQNIDGVVKSALANASVDVKVSFYYASCISLVRTPLFQYSVNGWCIFLGCVCNCHNS